MLIAKASLLFVLSIACATVRASEDNRAIVGAWRYVSEVDTRPDGSPAPASALSPTQGLLIYTAEGFMAVVMMPEHRHWVTESATLDQLRETIANGNAYAGRYEVDSATHKITHITSVSLEPQYEGIPLTRTYAIDGNTLKLSGTFPYRGETVSFVISWARIGGTESKPTVSSP